MGQRLTCHTVTDVRVRRLAGEKLNDRAAQRPDIRRRGSSVEGNHLGSHYPRSVPFTQLISITGTSHRWVGLTPVRRPRDVRQSFLTRLGPRLRILFDVLHGLHVERNAEVGKLNIAVLRGEDVRRLEIAVDDLIKSVNQTGLHGMRGRLLTPCEWR